MMPDDPAAFALGEAGALQEAMTRNGKHLGPIFTANALQHVTFDPMKFAVPGLIPQGASLFCGAAKIGKSRLALGIATAVATGGVALSYTEVAQGRSLYLALEDGPRRLQERIGALWNGDRQS